MISGDKTKAGGTILVVELSIAHTRYICSMESERGSHDSSRLGECNLKAGTVVGVLLPSPVILFQN